MAKGKDVTRTRDVSDGAGDVTSRKQAEEVLLKAGALQRAVFNSVNFSSIAADAERRHSNLQRWRGAGTPR